MPRKPPQYIRHEKTRHGKWTWAFRRKKEYVRLPDEYGTKEFWTAYNAALVGKPVEKPKEATSGTVAWLVDRYKESARFSSLAPSTQRLRANILKSLCSKVGTWQFAKVDRKHIQAAMDAKRETPHAANNTLLVVSQLFDWAVKAEKLDKNPCAGVEPISVESDGFHTWTVNEVEQFRARHPVGAKARLALDILLFLGLRRSDLFRAGRQHVRDGVLTMRTQKTGETVYLTICDELRDSIDATPTGDLAFLTSATGRPFSSAQSFGNWFKARCREAGLPDECAAHGLRKAGATIAAERGATTKQLMAMYGWTRPAMAEHYTKEADKLLLARAASERIANSRRTYLNQESNVPTSEALENKASKTGV